MKTLIALSAYILTHKTQENAKLNGCWGAFCKEYCMFMQRLQASCELKQHLCVYRLKGTLSKRKNFFMTLQFDLKSIIESIRSLHFIISTQLLFLFCMHFASYGFIKCHLICNFSRHFYWQTTVGWCRGEWENRVWNKVDDWMVWELFGELNSCRKSIFFYFKI